MAVQKPVSAFLLQFLLVILLINYANAQNLRNGFYKQTCPAAESIISQITQRYISRAPTLAAALLRMHFHDCFVRVCLFNMGTYHCGYFFVYIYIYIFLIIFSLFLHFFPSIICIIRTM